MNKNMSGLLKQAQKMQDAMQKAQEGLSEITVEGSAGGGMVTVKATAEQKILEIKINPEVIDPDDAEMLEDMILAAVNQAMDVAKKRAQEELSSATGGMLPNIPGLG